MFFRFLDRSRIGVIRGFPRCQAVYVPHGLWDKFKVELVHQSLQVLLLVLPNKLVFLLVVLLMVEMLPKVLLLTLLLRVIILER